jgi:hypothetical protein
MARARGKGGGRWGGEGIMMKRRREHEGGEVHALPFAARLLTLYLLFVFAFDLHFLSMTPTTPYDHNFPRPRPASNEGFFGTCTELHCLQICSHVRCQFAHVAACRYYSQLPITVVPEAHHTAAAQQHAGIFVSRRDSDREPSWTRRMSRK